MFLEKWIELNPKFNPWLNTTTLIQGINNLKPYQYSNGSKLVHRNGNIYLMALSF